MMGKPFAKTRPSWPVVLFLSLVTLAAWSAEPVATAGGAGSAAASLPVNTSEERMSFVMVDIESDGPIPGDFSMIALGAVVVEGTLEKTFFSRLKPLSEKWIPEALAVSGFSREETLAFEDPKKEMARFETWLGSVCPGKPVFVSDNNGYDWQFVNWYFHHFLGRNPFGYSSQNLGSLYKGMVKDMGQNFKHLRKTTHTHNPLDDAKGNAEALVHMIRQMGLAVPGWKP